MSCIYLLELHFCLICGVVKTVFFLETFHTPLIRWHWIKISLTCHCNGTCHTFLGNLKTKQTKAWVVMDKHFRQSVGVSPHNDVTWCSRHRWMCTATSSPTCCSSQSWWHARVTRWRSSSHPWDSTRSPFSSCETEVSSRPFHFPLINFQRDLGIPKCLHSYVEI